eukprot:scaffold5997_cov133-Cylindrotheca_fusiformis.AAC.2
MILSFAYNLLFITLATISSHSFQYRESWRTRCVNAATDESSAHFRIRGGGPLESASTDAARESDKLIKFYTLKGGMCPYAARTWMTLLELGIPFEMIEVSREDKEDWYHKINPRGKVPAIMNTKDGFVTYESAICDEYLSDLARHMDEDGPIEGNEIWKLMPTTPSERAVLRLLNDHVDTQLSPSQFTLLMNKDPEKETELIEKIEKALNVLEETLAGKGGPYLMGEAFSIADIHLLPFFLRLTVTLKHYKNYELPKEKFSRLLAWFDLCSKKDSVRQASKSNEEIIETYNRFLQVDYAFGGLNKNKN